jgi:Fur family transcriptional regulator, peroxide stress response regulator
VKTITETGLTKQRAVVLAVIRESHEHLTAGEVFDRAKEKFPTISVATVYNSLRFLKESGQIAEIQFGAGGGSAARYDRITERHDHAVCTDCGRLVDIRLDVPPELVRTAARKSRFKAESIEFTLRGLCPDCSKKS